MWDGGDGRSLESPRDSKFFADPREAVEAGGARPTSPKIAVPIISHRYAQPYLSIQSL
jgi:hypothetical protein